MNPIKILLVEDSENDALLISHALEKNGYTLISERVQTAPEMEKALEEEDWDIVLSDHMMPQFSALEALGILKKKKPDIPFILVSGAIGEEKAVEIMKEGAKDYIPKDRLNRLLPTVRRELADSQIHKAQHETENQLHLFYDLLNQSNDAIFVIEPQRGDLLHVNKQAEILTGYTKNELLNKKFYEINIEQINENLWPSLVERIEKKKNMLLEVAAKPPRGNLINIELNIKHIIHPEQNFIIAVARNITRHKKLERKLARSLENVTKIKREWEMTFDNTVEIICVVTRDQKIIRCNKKFADFFGVSVKNVPGLPCHKFFLCPPEVMEKCIKSGQISETVKIKDARSGEDVWFQISCRPIYDPSGKILYKVVVGTDVTNLKKTSQQLTDSRNELRSRLEDMEKFYKMAVGRELQMKDLKNKIKTLERKLETCNKGINNRL